MCTALSIRLQCVHGFTIGAETTSLHPTPGRPWYTVTAVAATTHKQQRIPSTRTGVITMTDAYAAVCTPAAKAQPLSALHLEVRTPLHACHTTQSTWKRHTRTHHTTTIHHATPHRHTKPLHTVSVFFRGRRTLTGLFNSCCTCQHTTPLSLRLRHHSKTTRCLNTDPTPRHGKSSGSAPHYTTKCHATPLHAAPYHARSVRSIFHSNKLH